jgi:glycosyltransferase involved in cell wall biosynthesis
MVVDSGNEAFIVSLKHAENVPNMMYLYDGNIRNFFLPYKARFSRSTIGKSLSILSSWYNPIPIAYLRKLLVLEKPDIIHVHQLGPISVGALKVLKQLGFKVVQTFHGYYFECPKGSLFKRSQKICNHPTVCCKLYKEAYHKEMRSCDQIIAISSYVKQRLLKSGYNPHIITLLQNSISPEYSKLPAIKPKQPKEVLFVGRMAKAKGVHILLRALTKIEGIGKKYVVNLIGDGEDRPLFERIAKSFSIRVNFIGKVSDEVLEQYYERAWIVIMPSIFPELCPMVALEAMCHGCPIIASNVGGIPDFVLHGQTGFLFEPNDADELADRIKLLLDDEGLAENMSKSALETSKKFSDANHMKQLLNIYNKLLKCVN